MSSSPSPELETFIRDFITSHATTIFASQNDAVSSTPLIFTVYSNFLPIKEGPLPASKSAIDALPTVTITEDEECAICLTEYEGGDVTVTELPCKHRYHSECVFKWLGVCGSCPVCRYELPVDEEEERRRDGGVEWQVMITVDLMESDVQLGEDMDEDGIMEDLD